MSALFIGNVVYSLSQWAMIVAIAKLGSPFMVGQYSYALALTAPVILFFSFQLRNVQATDAADQYHFAEYVKLRVVTSLIAYAMILGVAMVGQQQSLTLLLVILFVGASKVIESISDICFGYFQKHEQMDMIARSMIWKGILSIIALAGALLLTHSLIVGSICMTLCWLGILVFYDIRNVRLLMSRLVPVSKPAPFAFKWNRLGSLAWLTLPLGIAATLDSLITNIPRYMLQSVGGEEAIGYYAAISYIMLAGGTFMGAMLQATSPRLAVFYYTDIKAFQRRLRQLLGASGLFGLLGIAASLLIGKQVLSIMYDDRYAAHNDVFVLIMIASALWYVASCLGTALTASRSIKVQVPIYIISCLAVLVAAIYFIPIYQLEGAAISLCIGMLVRTVMSAWCTVLAVRKCTKTSKEQVAESF